MNSSHKEAVTGVFSRAAPTYDTVGPRHFEYFARRLVQFTGVESSDYILDVATGTGAVVVAAAEKLGDTGRIVGIDLAGAMLERAAAALRDRHLINVELRMGDAEHLDFPAAAFDVVMCSFGLSSFSAMERALHEFKRVLKPGGRLGILDTFDWYFQHDARWRFHEDLLRAFGVVLKGNPNANDGLTSAVAAAGFTKLETAADTYTLVFHDEDEWWRWAWSHASRRLFEAVPPQYLDDLKGELFSALRECREPDGFIHGKLRATLVRARKPATPQRVR